ncbi:MAG: GTPase, partial [Synergistaceae bacterium]
ALLGEKVAAVSPKPQTTRNAVRCIYTTEQEQIVFVDTPGIHKPQHALGNFMMQEATDTLGQVDLVCYVVEASDRSIGEKDEMILGVLGAL